MDGRHGHPFKAREPVLNFLKSRWSQAPQTKSSTIQREVHEQFGQVISITHLNRLRKARGLAIHAEKKLLAQTPHLSPRGKREQEGCYSWPQPMRQDCSRAWLKPCLLLQLQHTFPDGFPQLDHVRLCC